MYYFGGAAAAFEISQHFSLIYKKLEQDLNHSSEAKMSVCCMLGTHGGTTTHWKIVSKFTYCTYSQMVKAEEETL